MPTPKSTSTSRRSSHGRATTLNTKSTPNLNVKYSAAQRPPIPPIPSEHTETPSPRRKSLGTPSRLSRSALPDDSAASDASLAMYSAKPGALRSASDDRNGNQNLEVGDVVDVPGGMHGTIKFIGEVRGKKGLFAGVELAKEWAARGKNDGDVDGTRYFSTSIKGAGIFLPSNKAYKRLSPPLPQGTQSATPTTPSLAPFNQGGRGEPKTNASTTPSLSSKFSQSVGPGRTGARSPEGKQYSRPSLPRPESPSRKTQNTSSTPANRTSFGNPKLSKSVIGAPRYAPSPTPGRLGASVSGASRSLIGDPGKKVPHTPKSNLKKAPNGVAPTQNEVVNELGPEPMFDSESDNTPIPAAKAGFDPRNGQARSRPVSTQDDEVRQLKSQLADRDKQLAKQAADIEEMQNSVNELQSNTMVQNPTMPIRSSRGSGLDDLDAPSLRALVREKNEKIKQLTDEFDSHRADFRDTIDILEHTSDETNRLHQEKIEKLEAELREMHERLDRGEDMDTVAQTLKTLDEQVQELEEGLEDARRGEAEARGEVEYLRGEVERTKAELDREKQRSAMTKNAPIAAEGSPSTVELRRELRRKDDEIKGLNAIMLSLNSGSTSDKGSPKSSRRVSKQRNSDHVQNQANGHDADQLLVEERQGREKLENEVKELQNLVDRKTYREEELENEIQRLRKTNAHVSSSSNTFSERTTRPPSKPPTNPGNPSIDWTERGSPTAKFSDLNHTRTNTMGSSRTRVEPAPESPSHSTTMTDGSNLWCDLCDTAGHDILSCTNMNGSGGGGRGKQGRRTSEERRPEYTSPRLQSHDREEDYSLDPPPSQKHPSQQHHQRRFSPPSYTVPNPISPIPENPIGGGHGPTAPPARFPAPQAMPRSPPQPQSRAPMPPAIGGGLVAGKASGLVDENKWCAMCESDGHDVTDCPFEGQF